MSDPGVNESTETVPLNPAAESQPLKNVVICCTSVPDEKNTQLGQYAKQLGATHRYDLTQDVTHLIVGNHNTAKYKYVARERPDVKPMTIEWIEAVRDLWVEDSEIDGVALEAQYRLPTLSGVRASMTGCDDRKFLRFWGGVVGAVLFAGRWDLMDDLQSCANFDVLATQRVEIADLVRANGAVYEGDLTKSITHLISFRTEGAKYKAAKNWGLKIVSVEWLMDSLERGMILDEELYNPTLPQEERGKGAWDRTKPRRTSLGKRTRDESTDAADGGKRKLRRTASTKLNSQNESIWGDIVGGGAFVPPEVGRSGMWDAVDEVPTQPNEKEVPVGEANETEIKEVSSNPSKPELSRVPRLDHGFFINCRFLIMGFNSRQAGILRDNITAQDGEVLDTAVKFPMPSRQQPVRNLLVVPHNATNWDDVSWEADATLDVEAGKPEVVTEWWLERCIYAKKFIDPNDHVIGRPFKQFPLDGFEEMTISSAAFSGIDLLHMTKAVELLGAKYSEAFTKQSTILLTKSTVGLRKDKVDAAREWNVPIVDANWLWDCIDAEEKVPLQKYRFRGQKRVSSVSLDEKPELQVEKEKNQERPAPNVGKPASSSTTRPPRNARLDNTAFSTDEVVPAKSSNPVSRAPGFDKTAFETDEPAPAIKPEPETQNLQIDAQDSNPTANLSYKSEPLSEINTNSPTRSVSTAPAASGHPNSRPKDNINNAISSLLAKTKTTAQPTNDTEPRKRGRILGRAASNVSVSGTALSRATSVDSTATHGNPVEYPVNASNPKNASSEAARRSANERIERFLAEGNGVVEEESQPPSSTQLQYDDPESREYKERVMARLLGEKVDEGRLKGRKGKGERVNSMAGSEVGSKPVRRRGRPPAVAGFR